MLLRISCYEYFSLFQLARPGLQSGTRPEPVFQFISISTTWIAKRKTARATLALSLSAMCCTSLSSTTCQLTMRIENPWYMIPCSLHKHPTGASHPGNIQGTFTEHSGNIKGKFSEHAMYIQGTFSEHSVNIQRTFSLD